MTMDQINIWVQGKMKWIKRNYRTYGTENEDYQCLLVFNYACFNPWDGAKGVNIFEQFWHIDEDP